MKSLYQYLNHIMIVLISGLLLLSSTLASAQIISAADAANHASKATGGKVLKVKKSPQESADYMVKILSSGGKVHYVFIDGKTGKVKEPSK